jgi:acetolactate synthase-1/2/3 large subunit
LQPRRRQYLAGILEAFEEVTKFVEGKSPKDQSLPSQTNNADRIIRSLLNAGVQRLFGMPGGGSGVNLIAAAGRAGLPFSLAHTETASAFMAAAQAEITGKPGACLATLGPGAASLVNGVANAYLDRVPLIALTDCQSEAAAPLMQHQTLPQGEMFSPIVKWSGRLRLNFVDEIMAQAIATACSLPHGPVHIDVSGQVTSAIAAIERPPDASTPHPDNGLNSQAAVDGERTLRGARRPVFLIGLGARTKEIAKAIRDLCECFGIPALVTYKAKGVVPDTHRWFGGVLTNGAMERDQLERADAFIAVGLDPVELLPRPWEFPQPVISISSWPLKQRQVPVAAEWVGNVVECLHLVGSKIPQKSSWVQTELSALVQSQRERMRPTHPAGKLAPHRVVEIAYEVYGGTRATVDAGAFMFPVMALWPAENPCDVLISNGLSTMGFALPAAIGAALLKKGEPVVAFTGDGGLLMCLGELRTAAREDLPLRIVVFDDGVLSLIRIKQMHQGYATDGVSVGDIDWASLGKGLGVRALVAESEDGFREGLRATADYPGPVLIAARVNPDRYPDTMRVLRG